jgi:hypothetical protein
MPADHGLRLDDEEVGVPGRPEPPQPGPKNAVRVPQAGSGIGSKGDLELVAENEVFKRDVTT